MSYCPDCKINTAADLVRCPLCQNELQDCACSLETGAYPGFEPVKLRRRMLMKAVSLLAVTLIAASVFLNIITWRDDVWCVVFSACVLYAWGPGLLTFNKRVHPGWKLTAHAVAIPLLLVVINVFSSSAVTISRVSWAVSYTMPAIFIGFIITINFIIIRWKQKRRDYLLYQLSLCVIGFIPLILVLSGVAQPVFPSIAAAGCSFATIIWLILYQKKMIRSEFARKFHI